MSLTPRVNPPGGHLPDCEYLQISKDIWCLCLFCHRTLREACRHDVGGEGDRWRVSVTQTATEWEDSKVIWKKRVRVRIVFRTPECILQTFPATLCSFSETRSQPPQSHPKGSFARAANSVTHILYFYTFHLKKSLRLQNFSFHCPRELLNPIRVKSRSSVRWREIKVSKMKRNGKSLSLNSKLSF